MNEKQGRNNRKNAVDRFFNKDDAASNQAVNLFLKQRPIKDKKSEDLYSSADKADGK